MYNFFAYVNRMKYINRWSLMRNVRGENLMEHSHMAAVIAHALAVIDGMYFGGNVSPERAAAVALFHDAPETLTGDIPTPVKYYNPEINKAFKSIESVAEEKLLSMLPADMQLVYGKLFSPSPSEAEIVKCADKLCAYIKCIEELSSSNKEFTRAQKSILRDLRALDNCAVNYFLENFLPPFSLSLDALE